MSKSNVDSNQSTIVKTLIDMYGTQNDCNSWHINLDWIDFMFS